MNIVVRNDSSAFKGRHCPDLEKLDVSRGLDGAPPSMRRSTLGLLAALLFPDTDERDTVRATLETRFSRTVSVVFYDA
ncbi:hypothetical protein EYF80_062267 [Liparis tanakae]|uniref:Uncharacterized protein n=1 Tax=Liparis tanakae TaxID=230148 RepID=A0A4Z2EF83_9TELE|nr:hypothetical protein EYF80_062267 [Liparis tanakae]